VRLACLKISMRSGYSVATGGAYGIDGAAHRAALAAHDITVGVLAVGLDIPYPAGHSGLLRS
jgi:DNA processing protein